MQSTLSWAACTRTGLSVVCDGVEFPLQFFSDESENKNIETETQDVNDTGRTTDLDITGDSVIFNNQAALFYMQTTNLDNSLTLDVNLAATSPITVSELVAETVQDLADEADVGKVDEQDIRDALPRGLDPAVVNTFINTITFDGSGDVALAVAQTAVTNFINAGNVGLETHSEHFATNGVDHPTIWVTTKTGNIDITTNANIFNNGLSDVLNKARNNSALFVETEAGGDISIINTGDIIVNGDFGSAIHAQTESDDKITINNSGDLTVSGDFGAGIQAEGKAGSKDIEVTNSGEITVSAADTEAIDVSNDGTGNIIITNNGILNISGENSWGIDAFGLGDVKITNLQKIETQNRYSNGLIITSASEGSSKLVHVVNTADILINGPDGYGILAENRSTDGETILDLQWGKIQGGSGARTYDLDTSMGGFKILGSAGVMLLNNGGRVRVANRGVITSLNGLAIGTFEGITGEVGDIHTIAAGKEIINNLSTGQILGDIELKGGDDEINNDGLIVGNVDLGLGANSFINKESGSFFSGQTVFMGAGNQFTNNGIFSPGGVDQIITTTITGNLQQSATGKMIVDIDDRQTQKTDKISVTGSADLRGTIIPNIVHLDKVANQFTVLSAAAGITDNGLMAQDTIGFDFSLGLDNGDTDLILFADPLGTIANIIDTAPPASGGKKDPNVARFSTALTAFETSGSVAGTQLVNSLRLLSSSQDVAEAVERLIPKSQERVAGNAVSNNVSFSNAMLSCKQYEGPNRFTKEGQCYWGKVTGRRFDRDATSEHSGAKETAYELTTGIQYALENDLRFGFALGFEDSHTKSFSQAQSLGNSDGKSYRGGIVLKNQWGPINAYFNLMGNYARLDHKRLVNLPGLGNIASAKQDVSSGLGRIRLSYLFDQGPWYVKPIVDVDATYLHLGGYTEKGAGAANLSVASSNEWLFGSTLSLEVGGEHKLANGSLIRPYIRGGVRFISEDEMDTTVNFAGAPAGLAPFQVNSKLEDVFGEVEAGLYIVSAHGINLHMMYEGRFSEDSEQHAGSIKAGINF